MLETIQSLLTAVRPGPKMPSQFEFDGEPPVDVVKLKVGNVLVEKYPWH